MERAASKPQTGRSFAGAEGSVFIGELVDDPRQGVFFCEHPYSPLGVNGLGSHLKGLGNKRITWCSVVPFQVGFLGSLL